MPFVDIEIVVHLRCWSSTFDWVCIEEILEMTAHSHFILLVVLVDHKLVSTDRRKRDAHLLIQSPAIVFLLFLFWIELVNLVLVRRIWILVIFIGIGVWTFAPAWSFQWVSAPITVNSTCSIPIGNFSSLNMGHEALNVTCYNIFSIKLWFWFFPRLPILRRSTFWWCRLVSNFYILFISLITRRSNGTLTPLIYRCDIAAHLHDRLLRCGYLGSLSMRCAKSLVCFLIRTWAVSIDSRVVCCTTLLLVSNVIGTTYLSITYSLYLIHVGALTLRLGLSRSDKVMHGLLCFQHFCFSFFLLIWAFFIVDSIAIFIIGYIINTSLTTGLIFFLLNLIFIVISLILFICLVLVLVPSSKLHIAAVELDLRNKVRNGTIFFFLLIDWVIVKGPLLFI